MQDAARVERDGQGTGLGDDSLRIYPANRITTFATRDTRGEFHRRVAGKGPQLGQKASTRSPGEFECPSGIDVARATRARKRYTLFNTYATPLELYQGRGEKREKKRKRLAQERTRKESKEGYEGRETKRHVRKDGKREREETARNFRCGERETREIYGTVEATRVWWPRSRTSARAGSITSPMIYPTESSLLLRCEEEKDREGEERERERETKCR